MAYFEAAEATIKTLDITVGALSNRVISIESEGLKTVVELSQRIGATEKCIADLLEKVPDESEIDYGELGEQIDYSQLAEQIDTGSIVQDLDYGQIAGEINMGDLATEFADGIDIRDIANEIDLDDLASKVSDEVVDRLSDIPALEQIESRLTAIENGHPIGNPDKTEAAVAGSATAELLAQRVEVLGRAADEQARVIKVLNETNQEAVRRILTLEEQVKFLKLDRDESEKQIKKLLNFFKAFGALAGG